MYIPLVVGAVIFWVVLTLAERKTDKTYNFSKFIENLETGQLPSTRKGIGQYIDPIIKGTQNKIKLSKNVTEELEKKFFEANMNMTPQQFYTNKILYPVVTVIIFLVLALTQEMSTVFYILAALSSLTYFYPNYVLKQKIQLARETRRVELPNYLTPLGLLLYSYTPYQSVKRSAKFAGPYLTPYVERLIIEMEMYPASTKPFSNFANNVGLSEAQTFMTALQQAVNTDVGKSKEIIENQIEMMRKMREENYLTDIEIKPMAMNKYNFAVLLCIMDLVGVALINVLTSSLTM